MEVKLGILRYIFNRQGNDEFRSMSVEELIATSKVDLSHLSRP